MEPISMFDFEKYKEKQKANGVVQAYEPWTAEEDAQLRAEFEAHTTLKDMSERHGRTRGAIKTRLTKLALLSKDGKASRTSGKLE